MGLNQGKSNQSLQFLRSRVSKVEKYAVFPSIPDIVYPRV